MPELMSVTIQVTGADEAIASARRLTPAALKELREAIRERAKQTVFRFKAEMEAEYTSAWATGMLAQGITFKTFNRPEGAEVKFYIQDRRELRYVTAMLGGYFKRFPVGPFTIRARNTKMLRIPFPNSLARRYTRGEAGKFTGSRPGSGIYVKEVLWGKRSGGFPRDVISEVAEQEGALFVRDMEAAVQKAITSSIS